MDNSRRQMIPSTSFLSINRILGEIIPEFPIHFLVFSHEINLCKYWNQPVNDFIYFLENEMKIFEIFKIFKCSLISSISGKDEDTLIDIICSRTQEEMLKIVHVYKSLFDIDLVQHIQDETSGAFSKLLISLVRFILHLP